MYIVLVPKINACPILIIYWFWKQTWSYCRINWIKKNSQQLIYKTLFYSHIANLLMKVIRNACSNLLHFPRVLKPQSHKIKNLMRFFEIFNFLYFNAIPLRTKRRKYRSFFSFNSLGCTEICVSLQWIPTWFWLKIVLIIMFVDLSNWHVHDVYLFVKVIMYFLPQCFSC